MPKSLAEFDAMRKAGGVAPEMAAAEPDSNFQDLLARADALIGGGGGPAGQRYESAPAVSNKPLELADPGQGSYFKEHPNTPVQETTNPLLAMLQSGASTVGSAAKGLALSPLKAVASLPQLPGQMIEGLAGQTGLPALLSDPSLLGEVPASLNALRKEIGANPEVGGDLIGQMLMARYAPSVGSAAVEAAPGVAIRGANVAGRGLSTTGRLLRTGSEALIDKPVAGGVSVPGLGALEAVMGSHPVAGLATAAAPYVGKFVGKGMERVGGALEGLKRLAADTGAADTSAADMVGGRALAYEGSGNSPAGRYHAQTLLENPAAQAFMQREFNANKPIADEVFGRNVDLMGNPKQPPFTSAWEQARQQVAAPREADLTAELDALANKPRPAMSALGKLMERPAFESLPQGEIAMPKAAPRPSRARPVAAAEKSTTKGKSPQQVLNEEALAARRKKAS